MSWPIRMILFYLGFLTGFSRSPPCTVVSIHLSHGSILIVLLQSGLLDCLSVSPSQIPGTRYPGFFGWNKHVNCTTYTEQRPKTAGALLSGGFGGESRARWRYLDMLGRPTAVRGSTDSGLDFWVGDFIHSFTQTFIYAKGEWYPFVHCIGRPPCHCPLPGGIQIQWINTTLTKGLINCSSTKTSSLHPLGWPSNLLDSNVHL